MKQIKSVIISLNGGLGNQLFQLAAGLSLACKEKLILTSEFGLPRRSQDGAIELMSFQLPERISLQDPLHHFRFLKKVAGLLLRVSTKPDQFKKNSVVIFFLKLLSRFIFTIHYRKSTSIFLMKGLGFSSIKHLKNQNLFFGYFQSYIWVDDPKVKTEMMKLDLKTPCQQISKYSELSRVEKPLIVHVRLGDYLLEKDFGIPSPEYYSNAIKKALTLGTFQSIWLFSDTLDEARKYLPNELSLKIREFNSEDFCTSLSFQIMRLGHGYVIANSTFSWWAAYLTRSQGVPVIAPDPWFKSIPQPKLLIPPSWILEKSKFE